MEAPAPAPSTGIDYSRFDGIGDDDDDDEPPEIIHRPILPDNEPQPKPPPVPFDLSTQNVPALAKICERVGGKPVDEAKLARELERHAALWARDDAPDQHKIPTWTRPCAAQPEAGLIARIRKDPGGVVAPVLKVRKKEVRRTPLGPRVRLELGDGGNDAMAAHCKGDLTEKLRCCRPNALLRFVQWLVNDINGTKVIIVLQFDYVLQSVEDPAKFVAVPPPERSVQPEDEVKARVEANRAAALAIRDAKRRRQEAPPPSTEEAPLGIFRSSEEAKVVDAALGAALGAACLSHVYGPAGSGKSWLCATLAARALLRRKREAVVYLSATRAGASHAADHVRNIAVTLGVDKDDAAGRTVVASFLNSEQMALALDNDAQWLARKRGVSLVVVDSAAAVCKDLPRHDRNAALRRILAAAKELARALNVAVVLVNEISHDFSDGARQGAYRPAMEQLYAFCGRTFRVAHHVQGRRSVALMGSSASEEMRAPLAIARRVRASRTRGTSPTTTRIGASTTTRGTTRCGTRTKTRCTTKTKCSVSRCRQPPPRRCRRRARRRVTRRPAPRDAHGVEPHTHTWNSAALGVRRRSSSWAIRPWPSCTRPCSRHRRPTNATTQGHQANDSRTLACAYDVRWGTRPRPHPRRAGSRGRASARSSETPSPRLPCTSRVPGAPPPHTAPY